MLQDTKCLICGDNIRLNGESKIFNWQLTHLRIKHPERLLELNKLKEELREYRKVVLEKACTFENDAYRRILFL